MWTRIRLSSALITREWIVKVYREGETGKAVCPEDGLVATTFAYRDVPFEDGRGLVKDILVAVCDVCGKVVATPPQSTPAIFRSK